MTSGRPLRREDFEVAIICALPLEYDAVSLLFDELWDGYGDLYGRAAGDHNSYTTGRISNHNVVLALLPGMGKVNATSVATNLRASYSNLRLALLVGICGGMPQAGGREILLGDVVISKAIVQYDFGRQYPDGFVRKDTVQDNLGPPNKDIRGLLAIFQSENGLEQLQQRTTTFLEQLQTNALRKKRRAEYAYPGAAEDKLFESSYRHKHRSGPTCVCRDCHGRLDPVCQEALDKSCSDLGCDERYLVPRERIETKLQLEEGNHDKWEPMVHIGSVASGDKVMKSGEDRDTIATIEGVIAFEMEGAGVWEEIPCIVVKGVCDYADSHKNKKWQGFAAAVAASTSKAILERYAQTINGRQLICHWTVPFGRNESFVGREAILRQLLERIPPSANRDDCQRTAIEGLGGIGKTQIALEAAFRVRDIYPDCSVFWVPAVDAMMFENAYRDIGRCFSITGINEDNADIKALVKTTLNRKDAGKWLLIIDNADDMDLFFGPTGLSSYLPFSEMGSILFTTRNHLATVRLDIPMNGIIDTTEMSLAEATKLLQIGLKEYQTYDTICMISILEFLANLPLAIKQASAFMAQTGMTTTKYLDHCRLSDKTLIKLLSKDFQDRHRYNANTNPVAMTWLISFDHISRNNPLATQYLRFMSFLAEKDIPTSLLPPANDNLEADEAIGILKAYAFITQRKEQDSFDIHRLVRLAMQNQFHKKEKQQECILEVIRRISEIFSHPSHENKHVWMKYLPHAQAALNFRENCIDKEVESSLLNKIGGAFLILGKYRDAEQMTQQALELSIKVFGKEHPKTLTRMGNLALVLTRLGKYEEAEEMHRHVLDLSIKVLGREHSDTLTRMDNLARVLRNLGKYGEAEQMHRHVLKLSIKVLGREHFDTLISMDNLAKVLMYLRKYEEAEQMQRQVLELSIKVFGQEHPEVLIVMGNLANTLRNRGKYDEAEQMHRQALEWKEKVLGQEHPETLISMDNLAKVLRRLGKYEEAEQMHRQALEMSIKVLGREHPKTLNGMDNLASVLRNLGKYEEAEQMHRPVLELSIKVLGQEHPATLASMDNLAKTLRNLGKYDEAEQMHRQALELREKVLG